MHKAIAVNSNAICKFLDDAGVEYSKGGAPLTLSEQLQATVKIFDAHTMNVLQTIPGDGRIPIFLPDNKTLALRSSLNMEPMELWDIQTGALVWRLPADYRLAFSRAPFTLLIWALSMYEVQLVDTAAAFER